MSTDESQVPDASPPPPSNSPHIPLNGTTESQHHHSPLATATFPIEAQLTPVPKLKRKPFWARWGLTLPLGGTLPWLSNDFYWVAEKLRYQGYCFKVVNKCPTIDRKNMEMAWAQFCLLKARQMRRKSVKTEEEFERLSDELSRAIYQIEGYEGFDVVSFWSTHQTVVEAQYGIEVGIQSDFDYAAPLLPQSEIIKSKCGAKELDEVLQKELLDTRLTEEEKFDFEVGDIEEGLGGLLSASSANRDENDNTKANREDEDEDETDEEEEEEEEANNESNNPPAKRKRDEERAPSGYDEEGLPYWTMEAEVYEDDDSDLDDLPEETVPSAPKRQKLSLPLLNQISQHVSAKMLPLDTDRNSPSLPLPFPVPSTAYAGTSQNRFSMAPPSLGPQKSNQSWPSLSPRPPRVPKNMSAANATPLGSRESHPSLPPLPQGFRKISEANATPIGTKHSPKDVHDIEDAFDGLTVRAPSPAPK